MMFDIASLSHNDEKTGFLASLTKPLYNKKPKPQRERQSLIKEN
jgi:hypothetical protein